MLKNWYIATFVTLITVMGVGFVPFSVPNQEIVVQFSETTSKEDAATAIAQVRAQLEVLGVHDVQISHRANGTLKISYYSDIDVSAIQAFFTRQQHPFSETKGVTPSGHKNLPFQESFDAYQFTVSEIGNEIDVHNGLKGHLLEIDTKSSRFYPPDFSFTAVSSIFKKELKITDVSVLIFSRQSITVGLSSRLFPETRAGPIV
ncbi:hypothetical protein SCB49_01869 [unidentified eubacterium SCB49]|nr:hypothetical protein SCB49_01869 [unidentified eubacterium SCB49]